MLQVIISLIMTVYLKSLIIIAYWNKYGIIGVSKVSPFQYQWQFPASLLKYM